MFVLLLIIYHGLVSFVFRGRVASIANVIFNFVSFIFSRLLVHKLARQ